MDTYEQADELLDVLDQAPVGVPGALFKGNRDRQWMESCIIRAVKKLQAAEYHHANIESHVQDLQKAACPAAGSLKGSVGKMSVRIEKDQIAFELDAFLAAARACLDFVSGMLALHRRMDRKTGSARLLKNAEKNPTAPFGALLNKWRAWIEEVKEYRDQCIHYQTIYMSGGYELESRDGENFATVIPVLVPGKMLPDKPTTRTGRNAMALVDIHKNVGIEGVPPHATGPLSDEARKVMDILAEFEPKGYVPVEDFCGRHLEELRQFVSESFREVLPLKFKSYVG